MWKGNTWKNKNVCKSVVYYTKIFWLDNISRSVAARMNSSTNLGLAGDLVLDQVYHGYPTEGSEKFPKIVFSCVFREVCDTDLLCFFVYFFKRQIKRKVSNYKIWYYYFLLSTDFCYTPFHVNTTKTIAVIVLWDQFLEH